MTSPMIYFNYGVIGYTLIRLLNKIIVSKLPFDVSSSLVSLMHLEQMVLNDICRSTTNDWIHNVKNISFLFTCSGKMFSVRSHSVIFTPKHCTQLNPIIIIHGANSGVVSWFKTAIALASYGYVVHCVSLPGFGGTTVKEENELINLQLPKLIEFFVTYMWEYVTRFCKNVKVILLGHSFGGSLVTSFVTTFPDLCSSFILVNSAGIVPVNGKDSWLWAILFKLGIPSYPAKYIGSFLNTIMFSYLACSCIKDAESHWYIAQITCDDIFGETLISRFVEFKKYCCQATWTNFSICDIVCKKCPPLGIVWGREDHIIPLAVANLLSDFSIKVKTPSHIQIMNGVGHSPNCQPECFAACIVAAIKDAKPLRSISIEEKLIVDKILLETYSSISMYRTEKIIDILHSTLIMLRDKSDTTL